MDNLISKKTLTEQIYDKLRYDITRKKIKCNERIDIARLKGEFGTSQTPIREAIMKLEKEGLVEFLPNVGAQVISIVQEKVSQVFDVNSILDCGAIYLAYQSDKFEKLVTELKQNIDAYHALVSSNPTDKYWLVARSTHDVFYKYADNDALCKTALQIEAKTNIYFGECVGSQTSRSYGAAEHYLIYEAVKNHDYLKTIEAMQKHWENSKLRLLQWCDEQGYK
jgi:DNA-binding GntR family transcriptional regulator